MLKPYKKARTPGKFIIHAIRNFEAVCGEPGGDEAVGKSWDFLPSYSCIAVNCHKCMTAFKKERQAASLAQPKCPCGNGLSEQQQNEGKTTCRACDARGPLAGDLVRLHNWFGDYLLPPPSIDDCLKILDIMRQDQIDYAAFLRKHIEEDIRIIKEEQKNEQY